VDVGEDTTLGNDNLAEKAVKLFVVANGELEVTGNDAGLLVVAGGGMGVSDEALRREERPTERRYRQARGSRQTSTRGRRRGRLSEESERG
jgi:hypothetical protein